MKLLDSGMLKGRVKSKVLGKVTMTVQNGEQVIRNASTTATPSRTLGLIDQRLKWANEFALYSPLKKAIAEGIQNRVPGRSDLNYFLQNNQSVLTIPFGITKQQRQGGAAIAFAAKVTLGDGSLRPVVAQGVNDNHLLSNLSIGSLSIGATTTIGELSEAIVANNAGWELGDQITYIQCSQTIKSDGPHVRCNYVAVVLTADNDTLVQSVAKIGFQVENNCLASKAFVGAGCWVHSRKDADSKSLSRVSTQHLVTIGMDAIHAAYRTATKLHAAAVSYDWTEDKEIVLQPTDVEAIDLAQRYGAPYRLLKVDDSVEDLVDFLYLKMGSQTYFFSGDGPELDTSTYPTIVVVGNFDRLGTISSVKVNGSACTNPTLSGNTLTVTLPTTIDGEQLETITVISSTGTATVEFGVD